MESEDRVPLPAQSIEELRAALRAERTRTETLRNALDLAAGLRHDMDNHRAKYIECEVVGCVEERAALAASVEEPS